MNDGMYALKLALLSRVKQTLLDAEYRLTALCLKMEISVGGAMSGFAYYEQQIMVIEREMTEVKNRVRNQ